MTVARFKRLKLGTGLTGTAVGGDVLQLDAVAAPTDPADDTQVWMPLVDSDGTVVLDDTGVIPTLITIA